VHLQNIVQPLLSWYDENKRDLPWRRDVTGYRVWVSEIMLQQTRVEAVKPYYERFLEELPTIEALANAPEDKLLKLWEGLGYYSRVRNMQKAAKVIVNELGGVMPDTFEGLKKLPGIGEYTAGAIASIAFGRQVPLVDGNVLRVISRIVESYEDIAKASLKKEMAEELSAIVPADRPGDFNQSLMELGATVCLPNGMPLCGACPVKNLCLANEKGVIDRIPQKSPKAKRKVEAITVLVLQDADGRIGIRKRGRGGLLSGMWEFPNLLGHLTGEEAEAKLTELGLNPKRMVRLSGHKHIFTHVEWHMQGYFFEVDGLGPNGLVWVLPHELMAHYALPSAFGPYKSIL